MTKIRVAILCGGASSEHEVSLQSAKNVYEAIDKGRYDPLIIAVTKDGLWFKVGPEFFPPSDTPSEGNFRRDDPDVINHRKTRFQGSVGRREDPTPTRAL